MADREISPEARQIVAAAFAFAGPSGGHEAAWRSRLNEGVLHAAAAMGGKPAWIAQDMLEAFIFSGVYNGCRLEESSTRLVVKIASDTGRQKDKDADGNEEIRTDRTDTDAGRLMRTRLDRLPIGSRILAWKVLEQMSSRDDGEKARVLKHFEVLQINKDSATNAGSPPAPATPPKAAGGSSAPPAATVDHEDRSPLVERINALSNAGKINFVTECRAAGIPNFTNPQPDQLDKVLVLLGEAEKL